MGTVALRLTGAGKRYGDRPVLDGLDLDVARHARLVVLGPSGSGKATLLRLLAGLEDLDAGELARPDGKTAKLTQPGQPERLIALSRRDVADCLSEELRRLDPDEIYHEALAGISAVSRGRTPVKV